MENREQKTEKVFQPAWCFRTLTHVSIIAPVVHLTIHVHTLCNAISFAVLSGKNYSTCPLSFSCDPSRHRYSHRSSHSVIPPIISCQHRVRK